MGVKHQYEMKDLTSALEEMNSKYIFETQKLKNDFDEAVYDKEELQEQNIISLDKLEKDLT